MANNKTIFFEDGAAYHLIDGKRVPVKSIAGQSPCDCEVDCCLQAIKLRDHKDNTVKYLYIFDGNISVGTLAELKAESTIL